MVDTTGYQKLGALLGGGAGQVREEAYQEGRYRTAQTENALAMARENQLQATTLAAQEKQIEDMAAAAAESGDPVALMVAQSVRAGGGNASQIVDAQLGGQEYGNREILGDPSKPLGDQFAAGQAVEGKFVNRHQMMGSGDFMDVTQPEEPLQTTPLGDSMVMENEASAGASSELAALRARTPMLGGNSGLDQDGNPMPKPPSGYVANPNYDSDQPIGPDNTLWTAKGTGGPADPETRKPLGVRERQVVGRVMNAGLNTANDLENIMKLPSEADTGFLGTGMAANPATTVMDATVGQLKYKISPSETRDLQRILGGLTNQMATMELMGMAGSEGIRSQYDALALRPYDTIEDKMLALALIRQTTENGLQTIIDVNPLPSETLAAANATLARLQKAIPFTVDDVMNLKYSKDPRATLASGSLAAQTAAGVPSAAPAAAPAAAAPAAGEIPDVVQPGFRYTDPEDGTEWEYGGPEPGTREQQANQDNWYPVAQ